MATDEKKQKLSPGTLRLLSEYHELWRRVFDAIYSDLADPSQTGYDFDALDIAREIVPRPHVFGDA